MKYWDMFNIIPIHQESKQSKTTVIIMTTRMAVTAAAVAKAFLRALFYKNTKTKTKTNKKKLFCPGFFPTLQTHFFKTATIFFLFTNISPLN